MPRVPEPAELADDIARLERTVEASAKSTRDAITRLADDLRRDYVRREPYDLKQSQQDEKIGGIIDRQTWLFRASVASLLFPVVVTLIVALIMGVQA